MTLSGVEDFSPDFFYEAVARRTPDGWAAEIRIPLASLRYSSAAVQTWGVILIRNYPRDFRYVMANTTIPKSSGCFLCHAATLTGLENLPVQVELADGVLRRLRRRLRGAGARRAGPRDAERVHEGCVRISTIASQILTTLPQPAVRPLRPPKDMRRLFRRSILWLLPVVVVPLGALLVMQYRTLRSLEAKTASAERNLMRNSLEAATAEIENRYRTTALAALSLSLGELPRVATLGEHFRRQRVPGASTYFVVRYAGDRYETGFFDAAGNEKVPNEHEAAAMKMSTASWHAAYKWSRVVWPALYVDEREYKHRVIMRPVVDASMHVAGVVGVILDNNVATSSMVSIGREALKARYPEQAASMTLRIAEKFPQGGREFITQPLGFVFTNWRAGIRDNCASPEEVASMQFTHNALWTGGAFVVLLGAIGLAIGAVARQMRLSQMKSEFVSNVSHELRTPLSSIRVFGEYMRLGRVTQPEKVQEYGEYIEAESRRLTQLINNILDFSKIESAEKQYRFCDANVPELVEHTVAAFAVPLRDTGVAVSYRGPAAAPPPLFVDKDALAQAVVNLLDNALKYSNGGKEIDVAIDAASTELRISVRDRGIGIAASEQKKIFEKFYRVGSGLVHDVKGSGLGLSIVQHVAKAHGGRVEVASAPGEGSTFTIVLPVARREAVPITRTEFA